MSIFRRKPDPSDAGGRQAQQDGETLAVSQRQRQLDYAELMGAFVEDAINIATARTARDRSEDEVCHG